ncbi:MAG TPA: M1 family metallopeptidase [Candidatus Eisenbacteria bacterium]
MRLDPARHRLDGRETIVYRSGADSVLHALYLHAYPNAYSGPRTLYALERERQGEDYALRDSKPEDLGWMTIDSVTADGRPAAIRMDETIAAVALPRPLAPGDSVTLALQFAVQVPKHFDRLGRTHDDYSVSQWYPKMVVYDEGGWHPDPFHYMAEFYGDFGEFDVAITLPDRYWVGATGVLAGASGGDDEIPLADDETPDDSVTVSVSAVTADSLAGRWPSGRLWVETDLASAVDGSAVREIVPRGTPSSIRVPRRAPVHYGYLWSDGARGDRQEADPAGGARPLRLILAARDTAIVDTIRALAVTAAPGDTVLPSMKTLRYRASRVHDFAWVASPRYVRADTTWEGIAIRSLSFRQDQDDWRDSKRFVVDAMRHHARVAGPYRWPRFTTTEAWCGGGAMEYPMLIMNEPEMAGGLFDNLDDTIAHELGHNWFYGMIANDERAHAWLDEGFAQWIEDDYSDSKYPRGLFRYEARLPWLSPRRAFTFDETTVLARSIVRDDRPTSLPAEAFASYPQYDEASYSRTVCMLRALRGELGDSTFAAFLHRYYRENLWRHPRPADVIRAAEEASGRDFAAFFHEWTETTDLPDFGIAGTSTERSGAGYRSVVSVRRGGAMEPSVAVEARFADGTRQETRATLHDRSTAVTFESGARLVGATLDPRHDVAERWRLDNATGLVPMRFRPFYDFPQTDAITVLYGPTFWHGADEGTRLGGWLEGRYLPSRDVPRGVVGFEGGWNVGTEHGATAWRAGAWRLVPALGARGTARALLARDEGLFRAEATLGNWATAPGRLHPWRTWEVGVRYRNRYDLAPVDPAYWSPGRTLNVDARYTLEAVGYRHQERLDLALLGGDDPFDRAATRSYARASATFQQELRPFHGGRTSITWRGIAGYASPRTRREALFDAGEGSRLDALDRFYWNDRGPLRSYDHFFVEGGGGIRGFAGRAALGRRLAALNVEVAPAGLPVAAFGDLGRLQDGGMPPFSGSGNDLADLGVSYRYGPVLFAAPVWVSRPARGDRPWDVRWLVSLDLAGIHPWW